MGHIILALCFWGLLDDAINVGSLGFGSLKLINYKGGDAMVMVDVAHGGDKDRRIATRALI